MFTRVHGKRVATELQCLSKRRSSIMILVGIDVASEKHDVAIVTERNLSKPLSFFTIPNREPGYKKLFGEFRLAKDHLLP